MNPIKFNVPFETQFEGWTYSFEPEKIVRIEDDLLAFLEERVPMSFDKVETKKPPQSIPKVDKVQTQPWTRPQRGVFGGQLANRNMAVFGRVNHTYVASPDVTPPSGSIDSDGVQWYGEGEVRSK